MEEQFNVLCACGDSAGAAHSVAAGEFVGVGAAPVVAAPVVAAPVVAAPVIAAPVGIGRDHGIEVPQDTKPNQVQLARNSIARLTNVLFSGPFQDAFLSLINNRDRSHVEFGIGAGIGAKGEHFWKAVAKKFIVVADGAGDPFGDLDLSLTVGTNPSWTASPKPWLTQASLFP
jgi:hypothetical protein